MAPYRNHVEARSSKTPARQYVSETHDHKPDAPVNFYTGTKYEMDEIIVGMNVLNRKAKALREAFDARQPVNMKLAAEELAKVSGQINLVAAHLAEVTTKHVNRRPRP